MFQHCFFSTMIFEWVGRATSYSWYTIWILISGSFGVQRQLWLKFDLIERRNGSKNGKFYWRPEEVHHKNIRDSIFSCNCLMTVSQEKQDKMKSSKALKALHYFTRINQVLFLLINKEIYKFWEEQHYFLKEKIGKTH